MVNPGNGQGHKPGDPPVDPPGQGRKYVPGMFRGNHQSWDTWSADNWPRSPSNFWCNKHWAPVPVEGRDGLQATNALRREAMLLVPKDVLRIQGALTTWIKGQDQALCCILGDERIAEIWGTLSVSDPGTSTSDPGQSADHGP